MTIRCNCLYVLGNCNGYPSGLLVNFLDKTLSSVHRSTDSENAVVSLALCITVAVLNHAKACELLAQGSDACYDLKVVGPHLALD